MKYLVESHYNNVLTLQVSPYEYISGTSLLVCSFVFSLAMAVFRMN